jgi:predicted TIM-barrel fold metal-dependent hydrolase
LYETDPPGAHPAYAGPVIDAHAHFDAASRADARDVLADERLTVINFCDPVWPPHAYPDWRATWEAEQGMGMALLHMPDLSGVGEPAFEHELVAGIRTARRLGAAGLKVWKNLGLTLRDAAGERLAIDDPRIDAMWRTAGEEGLPVAIHICDAEEFWEPITPANERYEELQIHPEYWFGDPQRFVSREQLFEEFERVVAAHSATTFVGLHFGCFMELDDVRRMLRAYPHYMVDTAARTFDLGRPRYRDGTLRVFAEHPDRVIFGTDLVRAAHYELPARSWEAGDPASFYAHHWRLFETTDDDIAAPFEFQQQDVRLTGLGLDAQTLRRFYWDNAQRTYRL